MRLAANDWLEQKQQENQITGNQLRLITSEMVNFLEPNKAAVATDLTCKVWDGMFPPSLNNYALLYIWLYASADVTIHADNIWMSQ